MAPAKTVSRLSLVLMIKSPAMMKVKPPKGPSPSISHLPDSHCGPAPVGNLATYSYFYKMLYIFALFAQPIPFGPQDTKLCRHMRKWWVAGWRWCWELAYGLGIICKFLNATWLKLLSQFPNNSPNAKIPRRIKYSGAALEGNPGRWNNIIGCVRKYKKSMLH